MKFLKWKNKQVGDFDIFAIVSNEEKNMIVSHFGTNEAEGISFPEKEDYFYFLNTKDRIITPMPMLSLAFGGMYNEESPYGNEIKNLCFDITKYKLKLYKE